MPKKSGETLQAGEIFAFPARHGGWGAVQVLGVDTLVDVVVLDHLSEECPSLATVTRAVLTRAAFHVAPGEHRLKVALGRPPDFVPLGVIPLLRTPGEPVPLSAGWEWLRDAAEQERHWASLPAAVRDPFARPERSAPVALSLGPTVLRADPRRDDLHLVFDGRPRGPTGIDAGPSAGFDWSRLDALPCLRDLSVTGDAPGLTRWLEGRPALDRLTWEHFSDETVELQGSHLTTCVLAGEGLRALSLPARMSTLHLWPRRERPLSVRAAREGAGVDVTARVWDGDDLAALAGLPAMSSLSVDGWNALSLRVVARYPRLRALVLNGGPGRLRDGAALAGLPALQTLHLRGCVAVDVDAMPRLDAWPALRELRAWGLHERDAAALKARWGRDRRVTISDPLSDEDVFATADLPIARWPESPRKRLVRAAFTAAARKVFRAAGSADATEHAVEGFDRAVARAEKAVGALDPDERAAVAACRARLREGPTTA